MRNSNVLFSGFDDYKIDTNSLIKAKGGADIYRVSLGMTPTGELYQWMGYDGDRLVYGGYELDQNADGNSDNGLTTGSDIISAGDHVGSAS